MQPTAFVPYLPFRRHSEVQSTAGIYQASGQEAVGPSALSARLSPPPRDRGCSFVPFASILELGTALPRIRQLHLVRVAVQLPPTPCAPAAILRFSLLESLSIGWWLDLSADTAIDEALPSLFLHMPRLKNLTVYGPAARPQDRASERQYPDPPFSLERFEGSGTLSAHFCAYVIAHSRGTLRDLTVSIPHADADGALLIGAIAHAAPHLRVLDLKLGTDARLLSCAEPIFAALTRVRTLRLITSGNARLEDVLALLAATPARTLSLTCRRDHREGRPAPDIQLVLALLQTPRLRSVTLHGLDIGDEDRRALLAHCRRRRMSCDIVL